MRVVVFYAYAGVLHTIDLAPRHPLQGLVVDTFVPNDTFMLGADCPPELADALEDEYDLDDCMKGCRNAVMICTGANACGKVSSW